MVMLSDEILMSGGDKDEMPKSAHDRPSSTPDCLKGLPIEDGGAEVGESGRDVLNPSLVQLESGQQGRQKSASQEESIHYVQPAHEGATSQLPVDGGISMRRETSDMESSKSSSKGTSEAGEDNEGGGSERADDRLANFDRLEGRPQDHPRTSSAPASLYTSPEAGLFPNLDDTSSSDSRSPSSPLKVFSTFDSMIESPSSSPVENATSRKHGDSSLRRGKWTVEEEAYVARVIQDFNSGFLDAPAGTTLRTYLSEKLQCDPMRITKKFTGDACIGKRVFHPAVRSPSNAASIDKAQVCMADCQLTGYFLLIAL
jgi:hypothetical protein